MSIVGRAHEGRSVFVTDDDRRFVAGGRRHPADNARHQTGPLRMSPRSSGSAWTLRVPRNAAQAPLLPV